MNKRQSHSIYIQIAFISNLVGIVLTLAYKGNIAIFGTLLILLAIVFAVIGIVKKKKLEKNQLPNK